MHTNYKILRSLK